MNAVPDSLPLIKPPRLRKGDVVAIVAPASAPPDPASLNRAVTAVTELGFVPRLGAHARARHGFLAGDDAARLADLMDAFTDPAVKGIICHRGGYGTARLLAQLDYEMIRRNPKVLVGYSDITALHLALLRRAGLMSFHGPMLNSELAAGAQLRDVPADIRLTGQPVIGQAFAESVTSSLSISTLWSVAGLIVVLALARQLFALIPALWTLAVSAGVS